jgi:3-hydroxyisobutyrate dehydrogenase-like beta-hydroxyacid dehydrogenase
MAGRLARAGFDLTVWNRAAGRAAPLTALGARFAASPAALAAGCDLMISMLSDGDAVRAVLCGDVGALAAMKLAVNLVVAATNQSVAEALALAESCGIDRASAHGALTASAVSSAFLRYKRDAYLHPSSAGVSFSAALMGKDLDLAIGVAEGAAIRLPVATAARMFLAVACEAGFAEADFACVSEVLRQRPAGGG